MNELKNLLKELCPDGVVFYTLEDVSEIKRGDRITKKDLNDKDRYPVKSGGRGYFGKYKDFNREANTITVAQYGSAGYVDFITEKFWANDVCYSILPYLNKVLNKYLYYCLCNLQ